MRERVRVHVRVCCSCIIVACCCWRCGDDVDAVGAGDSDDAVALRAVKKAANASAGAPGLKFMTQSWLLELYLDCPATFPTPPNGHDIDAWKDDMQPLSAAPHSSPEATAAPPPPPSNCSTIANKDKLDCGYPGMTAAACLAKDCCWDMHKANHSIPACFYAHPAPPGPRPPPPPLRLACPSAADVEAMLAALTDGMITFHAFPFNAEAELLSESLFSYGLDVGKQVATRAGIPSPTVMSQRDVPSMSRAVIPLLAKANVSGINVGVNDASAPIDVPSVRACINGELPTPFVWKDEASNTSVIASFHPGGYGRVGKDAVGGMPCTCIAVPKFDEALCYGWVGDNGGPPSAASVRSNWEYLQSSFENAVVVASSFDEYYALLEDPKIRDTLEVVTSEAGDTWVYGCSSDPRKLALLRLFTRHRDAAVAAASAAGAAADTAEPGLNRFSLLLLKASEHTWGLDGRCQTPGRGDLVHWSNADFEKARSSSLFVDQEDAWHEQRAYFSDALAALGPQSKLAAKITAELAQLDAIVAAATAPTTSNGMRKIEASHFGAPVQLSASSEGGRATATGMQIQLDPASGAIVSLRLNNANGESQQLQQQKSGQEEHSWASTANPLARFVYKSRSFQAGVEYYKHYQWINASWGPRVYEKLGVTPAIANETVSHAKIVAMATNGSAIVADLELPAEAWTLYGGPRSLRLVLSLPSMSEGLQITLTVLNKTATRIAEEAWFEFRPALPGADNIANVARGGGGGGDGWDIAFSKLGSSVDPTDMLTNGSKTLHGIDPGGNGVLFSANGAGAGYGAGYGAGAEVVGGGMVPTKLRLQMFDAGLVSPGPAASNMDLYAFPGVNCTPSDGVAASLWNNLWSVNYVFWYPFASEDASFTYRFTLQFS